MSIATLYTIVSLWVLFDVFHLIWLSRKIDQLKIETDETLEAFEKRMLYLED